MSLTDLLNSGIRPDTYVWCKGMQDWTRASEVPDICRGMRRALAGLDPETGEELAAQQASPDQAEKLFSVDNPPANRREMAEFLRQVMEEGERNSRPDYSVPPQSVSIFMAIVVTILCFPITGMFAVYFAYKSRADWNKSLDENLSPNMREQLRQKAHDEARMYRMMIGITFSIGIVMVGMTLSRMML